MITKYKDSVKLAYQKLYEDINKASNGEIQIDNLESFFGNIQEISKLDEKFLRLPLDEPLFEIDADSRKITVPSNFATNGLSVQGDHLAETVFFSIDRYFDYKDLNTCNIRINWKIGEASGQSINFSKSTDAEPGKIIFGWPVAKDLTGKSGTLSFAVEFYNEHNGNVTYSLNTLISTINIKEGLALIEPTVINVNDDILNMLQNSAFGEGDAEVPDLKWLTNGLVLSPEDTVTFKVINLAGNATDAGLDTQKLSSVPVKLYARAQAGAADIKYSTPAERDDPVDEYILVSKEDDDGNRIKLAEDGIYYVKTSDGAAYQLAEADDILTWNNPDIISPNNSEIYARYTTIMVEKAGEYYVNAQGVVFETEKNGEGHVIKRKIGQGPLETTPFVICPEPDAPDTISISSDHADLTGTGYSIDLEFADSTAFLTDGAVVLVAKASGYDNKDAYEAPAEGIEPKALIQYTWYKEGSEQPVSTSKWVRSNVEGSLKISEEGKYTVGIKSFLNGHTSVDEVKSNPYIVSPLASKINNDIAFSGLTRKNGQYWINLNKYTGELDRNATKEFNITYTLNGSYSDEVICTLFVRQDSEDGNSSTISPVTAASGVKIIVKDIEGGKHITLSSGAVDNKEGNYFIRLTNKYNGSAYSLDSDTFYININ